MTSQFFEKLPLEDPGAIATDKVRVITRKIKQCAKRHGFMLAWPGENCTEGVNSLPMPGLLYQDA